MVHDAHQVIQQRASAREEASELVARYPDLSERERARLIELYRNLSALDLALMLSNEEIVSKIERFAAENRRSIRRPFRQYAALVVYALLAAITVGWSVAVAT